MKQSQYVEAAAKLFSYMERSLILDQTRLIITLVPLPSHDVLISTQTCKFFPP